MNKIIENELKKCKKVVVPEFDSGTTTILIPKISSDTMKSIELELDKYYIIQIEKYIMNPPENFNLNVNWNKGINPKSEFLFATPIKFVGKMVQFNACGYDNINNTYLEDTYSELWLPRKSFKILKEC